MQTASLTQTSYDVTLNRDETPKLEIHLCEGCQWCYLLCAIVLMVKVEHIMGEMNSRPSTATLFLNHLPAGDTQIYISNVFLHPSLDLRF